LFLKFDIQTDFTPSKKNAFIICSTNFEELDDVGKYLYRRCELTTKMKDYFEVVFGIGDDVFNIIDFINIILNI